MCGQLLVATDDDVVRFVGRKKPPTCTVFAWDASELVHKRNIGEDSLLLKNLYYEDNFERWIVIGGAGLYY